MRMLFGVVSLLLVLAIVGLLSKKQLAAIDEIKVPGSAAVGGTTGVPGVPIAVQPGMNVQQQSQQIQQQFKAAAENALQPVRTEPDEK
jgi:hypothetical protein